MSPFRPILTVLLCCLLLSSNVTVSGQNVGIGTDSPAAKLDVADANSALLLRAGNVASGGPASQISFGYNANPTYRHRVVSRHNGSAESGNAIDFYVWTPSTSAGDPTAIGNTHTLSLNGGNVGVGLTNPEARFQVANNVATLPINDYSEYQILLYRSVSGAANSFGLGVSGGTMWYNSGGAHRFLSNGTNENLSVLANGNVGIGQVAPGARLDVAGNIRTTSHMTQTPQNVAAGAAISLPDVGTVIVTDDGASEANAATFSGTPAAGQYLTVINQDADSTGFETHRIPPFEAATFVYDGTNWKALRALGDGRAFPSTAIVLSETEPNTTIENAGYTQAGRVRLSIEKESINTESWTPTQTTSAPTTFGFQSIVWTGSELLIWGGLDMSFSPQNTGYTYNPITDVWFSISNTGAPSARVGHSTVWTGSEMIIWNGNSDIFMGVSTVLDDGGRYRPSTNSWAPVSKLGSAGPRQEHMAVWTGTEMFVWGGSYIDPFGTLLDGGRYNPATDSWASVTATGAPSNRYNAAIAWTGSDVLLWGGTNGTPLGDGAKYNPVSDTWSSISTTNAPSARAVLPFNVLWTGNEMLVWGTANVATNTGGKYNPTTNTWVPTSTVSAPVARTDFTMVWTGNKAIVWGGYDGSTELATGGIYDPAADTWTATTALSAPSARSEHVGVWANTQMIIWGGFSGFSSVSTGGKYVPPGIGWNPQPSNYYYLYEKD